MKRINAFAACAALSLAAMLGLAGCGAASAGTESTVRSEETITVSASSVVRLVPDKATVSFSVTTQEESVELAQSKNSDAVQKVMETLAGRGIEEKSIRTSGYSLYPQYDYSGSSERVVGYVVRTSLTVQDQDIDSVGGLISDCVAAGVNGIDSVSFLCSGYDDAYRQALAQAVTASKDKAAVLAQAAGRTLGEPVAITEGWQDTSARYGQMSNYAFSAEAAKDVGGPSFAPGETEIQANVTVTYRMK